MSTTAASFRPFSLLARGLGVVLVVTCLPVTSVAQFRDASQELGFSAGGKAAFVDYNGDGWIDVYAGGKLFRNRYKKAVCHDRTIKRRCNINY